MQLQNASRMLMTSHYSCIEPVPDWNQFTRSVGKGWIVFYIIGICFLAVSSACFITLIKFRRKVFRQSYSCCVASICLSGVCRGILLAVDPYCRRTYFPLIMNNMLVQISNPCILLAFIALQNNLIQAATIQVTWNKLQSIQRILAISIIYFAVLLSVEILYLYDVQLKLLRLFINCSCTLFSIYTCICCICTGFKFAFYLETVTSSKNTNSNVDYGGHCTNTSSPYSYTGIRNKIKREQTTSSYILDMQVDSSDSEECLNQQYRKRYRSNLKRRRTKIIVNNFSKATNDERDIPTSVPINLKVPCHTSEESQNSNTEIDINEALSNEKDAMSLDRLCIPKVDDYGKALDSWDWDCDICNSSDFERRLTETTANACIDINICNRTLSDGSLNTCMQPESRANTSEIIDVEQKYASSELNNRVALCKKSNHPALPKLKESTEITTDDDANSDNVINKESEVVNTDCVSCLNLGGDVLLVNEINHTDKTMFSNQRNTCSLIEYHPDENFRLSGDMLYSEDNEEDGSIHLLDNFDDSAYFADEETATVNSMSGKNGENDSVISNDLELKHVFLDQLNKPLTIHSSLSLARIRQCYMLHRVMSIAYFVTFAVVVNTIFQLYSIFGVYGVFGSGKIPEPWPWFLFHVLNRLVELTITVTLLTAVLIVLNYKSRKKKRTRPV